MQTPLMTYRAVCGLSMVILKFSAINIVYAVNNSCHCTICFHIILTSDGSADDGIQIGIIAGAAMGGTSFVIILVIIAIITIRYCRSACITTNITQQPNG